jgi:hypothetical protein
MICVLCQHEAVEPILSSDGHICAGHIYRPVSDDPYDRLHLPPWKVYDYFDLHGKARPEPQPIPPIEVSPQITINLSVTKANKLTHVLNTIIDTIPQHDAVMVSEIIHRLNLAIKQEVGICVL